VIINYGDDLMLFLTIICGQQYTELEEIPVEWAFRMERRFFEILDNMFEGFKKNMPMDVAHKLKKIDPPSTWILPKKGDQK